MLQYARCELKRAAVRAVDGALEIQSNVTLNLTPAFDKERVYLPLGGGTIVALTARDGQLYWRSDMGRTLSVSSPMTQRSTLLLKLPVQRMNRAILVARYAHSVAKAALRNG